VLAFGPLGWYPPAVLTAAWVLAGALALQAPAPPPSAPPAPGLPSPIASAQRAPAAPAAEANPLRGLFHNLGRDLRHLPSIGNVAVMAGGGAAALLVHPADDDLNEWAIDRGPSGYVKLGNMLGDGWFQGGAALGTYLGGRLAGDPGVTHLGSDLIRSQVLNAVLTRGLKLAAQRNRPHGGGDSMPSGHASAAFASATVIHAHYGWKGGVPAYAAAGFMAWSRVRDDRHWLTDVIIGGAIGTIAGRTVTSGHRSQWTVVPAASTQSAAIVIVHTFR
jgi:hypothetical protein